MIAADLAMALDAVAFARNGLGFEPDTWQADVLRWPGRRLLMNCSRQSGKSTTAAILALHEALYAAASLVLLVSPSLRQSSELFRKVTDLLGRLDIRPKLLEDNKLSLVLESGGRVVSLPSSEATIRGFSGVTLLIEDESARVSDDLYRATRPMLAVSDGRHILMSTPFGRRGHFFQEWEHGGLGWQRVRVTAEACPRISPAFLLEEQRGMGDWWYRQEFGCEFMDAQDSVFKYDDILAALTPEVRPLFPFPGGSP